MMGMESLRETIQELCSQVSGQKAVIVEDLSTGENLKINQNAVFPAASLIKLPVLLSLFHMEEALRLDLDGRVELREECRVGGFGILKDLKNGLLPTWRDLAVLMVVLSDNIAANLIIDRLGMEEINREIRALGLTATALKRKMMDSEAKSRGLDNNTTAEEIRMILKAISESGRDEALLDILFRQQCNNKLPALWETEVPFAHKTGDLPGTEHDAGIAYIGKNKVLMAVLTRDLSRNQDGVWLNQEIGRAIYRYFINKN